MNAGLRHIALVLVVLAIGCGGAVAGGPNDAAAADATADRATSDDASPGPADASLDSPALDASPDSALDAGPKSPCSVSRDVFHFVEQGVATTYTNLDTNWTVLLDPELDVMVDRGSGPAGSIQVWVPGGGPLQPGVYSQGPSATGPTLEIGTYSEGCSIISGTLTVDDIQTTGAPPTATVGSLALSFDVVCDGATSLSGCVQYSPGPNVADAGLPPADAAPPGTPAPLAPCLGGGNRMVVTGPDGVQAITGAVGTWSAGLSSESVLQVKIEAQTDWGITASSNYVTGSFLQAGSTYATSPGNTLPYLQYVANGAGCGSVPKGSFTIVDMTDTGGDQADVSKPCSSRFDLTCNDEGAPGA